MDGQSVKTTERGGVRGFDGHKLVRGRKRHILVDTLGLPIASRVEPAHVPDQKAGARLLAGLRSLFPAIRTVMADAGHQSRKLTRALRQHDGWRLVITKRGQRAFKIKGLTWIVERSFAWLGRNRRFGKDYEFKLQTSETLIEVAATRLAQPDRTRIATSLTSSQTWAEPPSANSSLPVTKLLSSEARKSAARAISVVVPSRPSGVSAVIADSSASSCAGEDARPCKPGVDVAPGASTLTRMPRGASSRHHPRAKLRMAALLAL